MRDSSHRQLGELLN